MEPHQPITDILKSTTVTYGPAFIEPTREAYASEGQYRTAKVSWDSMLRVHEQLGITLPEVQIPYLGGESVRTQLDVEWKPLARRSMDDIADILSRYHFAQSSRKYQAPPVDAVQSAATYAGRNDSQYRRITYRAPAP